MASYIVPTLDLRTLPVVRSTRERYSWIFTFWAAGSILLGGLLWAIGAQKPGVGSFDGVGGFGVQFVIWGLINGVFAWMGIRQASRVRHVAVNPTSIASEQVELQKLFNALSFNKFLNAVWVSMGVIMIAWAAFVDKPGPLVGHGLGVLVQGLFLVFFDAFIARSLQRTKSPLD